MCGGTNLFLRRYCPLWEWAEEADATHTDLLNPTSGRDASHPQLISMSSQVRCTHQVVCGGTNISLKRYCPLWEWAKEADATCIDSLNPTSGRDTSYPQLISMSSQVGCTHHGRGSWRSSLHIVHIHLSSFVIEKNYSYYKFN